MLHICNLLKTQDNSLICQLSTSLEGHQRASVNCTLQCAGEGSFLNAHSVGNNKAADGGRVLINESMRNNKDWGLVFGIRFTVHALDLDQPYSGPEQRNDTLTVTIGQLHPYICSIIERSDKRNPRNRRRYLVYHGCRRPSPVRYFGSGS